MGFTCVMDVVEMFDVKMVDRNFTDSEFLSNSMVPRQTRWKVKIGYRVSMSRTIVLSQKIPGALSPKNKSDPSWSVSRIHGLNIWGSYRPGFACLLR